MNSTRARVYFCCAASHRGGIPCTTRVLRFPRASPFLLFSLPLLSHLHEIARLKRYYGARFLLATHTNSVAQIIPAVPKAPLVPVVSQWTRGSVVNRATKHSGCRSSKHMRVVFKRVVLWCCDTTCTANPTEYQRRDRCDGASRVASCRRHRFQGRGFGFGVVVTSPSAKPQTSLMFWEGGGGRGVTLPPN